MSTGTFRNPIADMADPWIVVAGGEYYLTGTHSDHRQIVIARAGSLANLRSAPPAVVWEDDEPTRCAMMWAPELHRFDGPSGRRWYLYYTASDADDHLNHRLFVLEGSASTPLGPYRFRAQLQTDPAGRYYAIDGTPLQLPDGRMFLAWAGNPGHLLHISAMENPWTLKGERVHLPADGFGCPDIREGPVFLRGEGRIILVYSACDTGTPDYRLGMLVADADTDLLDPASWKQYPDPVFTRHDRNGVFGPGHNGFFRSPDGREDWIVYHAKTTQAFTYNGRTARAQRFTWTPDGLPDFGVPLPLDAEIPLPSGDPGAAGQEPEKPATP